MLTFERLREGTHMRYCVPVNANANPNTESHTERVNARTGSGDTRIRTFVVATDAYVMGSHASVGANAPNPNTDPNERNEMANARTYSPKELAAEIGIDPKVLRNYLRKNHTRMIEAKNTSWIITANVAADCRKAFTKNEAGSAKK
jgi:hypothetical protein